MLKAEVVFLLPEDGSLTVQAAYPPEDRLDANDLAAADWCWRNDTPAGRGSDNLPGAPRLFLPLRTGRGKLGVAGIKKDLAGPLLTPAERRLLDALLDQTALAIDRVQLARDVDASKLLAETERLRTALLTSIGHDLKTPLASILGAISSLRSYGASYGEAARADLLATAQEEAERLARFVDNLLDMTRLEAGALGAKREPVDVADAVGAALHRTGRLLAGHRVTTELPADLPLLRADFVLLEQVLVNLLENAARYAPAGTPVEIVARAGADALLVEVCDRGPGIPPDEAVAHLRPLLPRAQRATRQGRRLGSRRGQGLRRSHGRHHHRDRPSGRRDRLSPELPGRRWSRRPRRGARPCLIARDRPGRGRRA